MILHLLVILLFVVGLIGGSCFAVFRWLNTELAVPRAQIELEWSIDQTRPADYPTFLSTIPPTRGQNILAVGMQMGLLVLLGVIVPFSQFTVGPLRPFVAVSDAMISVMSFVIAVIMAGQFARVKTWSLLLVTAAFWYQGLFAFAHAFVNAGTLFRALPSVAIEEGTWVYLLWHLVYPLFIIPYAYLHGRRTPVKIGLSVPLSLWAAFVGTFAVFLALINCVVSRLLPFPDIVQEDGKFSPHLLTLIVPMLLLLHIATLLMLRYRGTSVLDQWLIVVVFSAALGISTTTVVAGHLFDFAYYGGRAFALIGIGGLAGALLSEMNRLYIMLFDLRERQKAESEAQYRSIIDTASDAIIVIDEDGLIRSMNPSVEHVFGYPPDELIAQHVNILIPETFRSTHDNFLVRTMTSGTRWIMGIGREVQGQRKSGEIVPLDLSVAEWSLSGRRMFTGIMRDISDRKRVERELMQAQKMEAVGQLTGGIAHDFNNMLGVIIGNLDLLSERFDPEVPEELAEAITASLSGAELVRQLLAFARRQPLTPRVFRPDVVLADLQPLLARAAGPQIELMIRQDENVWPVLADPTQLENCLLNLVINAHDAMPDGGRIIIECKAAVIDPESAEEYAIPSGCYSILIISDNGSGIPADILSRVTEPFFTTKPLGEASGLGLSMIDGYVRQSGGVLRIYSEVGHGTTVRLYLPAVVEGGSESVMRSERQWAAESANLLGTERVLVVDDELSARDLAQRMLVSLGYSVKTAEDANHALSILAAEGGFDVMFADVVMPGPLSALQLVAAAVAGYPQMKIVLTSGFSVLSFGEIEKSGAAYLTKPYRRAELARLFHDLLKRNC